MAALISLPFCCCGLIGLGVAIMMLVKGKDNSNSPKIFVIDSAAPANQLNEAGTGEEPVWWGDEEIED